MPHLRERFILKTIESKLKFSPVFSLQGARQTGKSYLARDIISKRIKNSTYVTFDQKSVRSFAEKRPEIFLDRYINYKPIIIDEAQKVPDIFDAIKFKVDQKREAGKFFILGSTEFSKLTNIRESLTGRMSRAKLYPLTIRETLSKPQARKGTPFYLNSNLEVKRTEFLRYLENGGMPGIFTVKNKEEKNLLLNDWISLTVERDVHTFNGRNINSDLTREILENIAILEEPNLNNISKAIKTDTRRIKSHIEVLETLFVINSLQPHKSGTGKTIYFILDSALASVLGASFEKILWTTVLNELLAKRSYLTNTDTKLYYYRTSKGSIVNFLEERTTGEINLLKIINDEKYDERNLEILSAYKKKVTSKVNLFAIAPFESLGSREKVKIYPWEAVS